MVRAPTPACDFLEDSPATPRYVPMSVMAAETHSIANRFVAELRNVEIQQDRQRFRRNMERFPEWLAVARKYISDFGLAALCGFGRMPPTEMPRVLEDHLRALG